MPKPLHDATLEPSTFESQQGTLSRAGDLVSTMQDGGPIAVYDGESVLILDRIQASMQSGSKQATSYYVLILRLPGSKGTLRQLKWSPKSIDGSCSLAAVLLDRVLCWKISMPRANEETKTVNRWIATKTFEVAHQGSRVAWVNAHELAIWAKSTVWVYEITHEAANNAKPPAVLLKYKCPARIAVAVWIKSSQQLMAIMQDTSVHARCFVRERKKGQELINEVDENQGSWNAEPIVLQLKGVHADKQTLPATSASFSLLNQSSIHDNGKWQVHWASCSSSSSSTTKPPLPNEHNYLSVVLSRAMSVSRLVNFNTSRGLSTFGFGAGTDRVNKNTAPSIKISRAPPAPIILPSSSSPPPVSPPSTIFLRESTDTTRLVGGLCNEGVLRPSIGGESEGVLGSLMNLDISVKAAEKSQVDPEKSQETGSIGQKRVLISSLDTIDSSSAQHQEPAHDSETAATTRVVFVPIGDTNDKNVSGKSSTNVDVSAITDPGIWAQCSVHGSVALGSLLGKELVVVQRPSSTFQTNDTQAQVCPVLIDTEQGVRVWGVSFSCCNTQLRTNNEKSLENAEHCTLHVLTGIHIPDPDTTTGHNDIDVNAASTMRMPISVSSKPRRQLLSVGLFKLPWPNSSMQQPANENEIVCEGPISQSDGTNCETESGSGSSSIVQVLRYLREMEGRMNKRFDDLERAVDDVNQRLDSLESPGFGFGVPRNTGL